MYNQLLISIVIPNYNNEKYIDECLESCVNQTYKNIEIIVVDDCSSDDSVETIRKHQERDSRIKLIRNTENMKVSKTRHIGVENAIGHWITTLDGDDFYISNAKIEKEVEILRRYNFDSKIIAYSGIVLIDKNGHLKKRIMNRKNTKEGFIFEDIITRSCAIPRDFTFSKKLYFEVGGFDLDVPIYEDWDFKIRLSKIGKYYYSGIDGIGYRQHGIGLSSATKSRHKKWIKYVFDKNTSGNQGKTRLERKLIINTSSSIFAKIARYVLRGF